MYVLHDSITDLYITDYKSVESFGGSIDRAKATRFSVTDAVEAKDNLTAAGFFVDAVEEGTIKLQKVLTD